MIFEQENCPTIRRAKDFRWLLSVSLQYRSALGFLAVSADPLNARRGARHFQQHLSIAVPRPSNRQIGVRRDGYAYRYKRLPQSVNSDAEGNADQNQLPF